MREQEHNLQVACVRWFRYRYPKALIFAIPNGGQRNAIVAAKLKAEGVMAGVPDLLIPCARGVYHGLFVEMKNGKKGRVSEAQSVMMDRLQGEWYKCAVCRSFDEFKATVEQYMAEC